MGIRETDRQTDRETERKKERDREREGGSGNKRDREGITQW